MASKKDKLLDSAQRFVLKGQLDSAIKYYRQIVLLDPKEVRYRQKLAELLVKDNRKEEAIAQYEDIGRHFADNCHFLKAIAVYKQIQRLSPGNITISLTLASLNHKQGLTGNALAEYGYVVAQLEKEGDLKEAIRVLEQMIEVDRDHAATRLKYAELLLASGANDDARRAFAALLGSLRKGGHLAAAQKVADRIARLFPGQDEDALDLSSAQIFSETEDALDSLPKAEVPDQLNSKYAMVPPPTVSPTPPASPVPVDIPKTPAGPKVKVAQPGTSEPVAAASSVTSAASDWPGAFDADEAPADSATADLSAWEEEIELDLDDGFGDFPPPPEFEEAEPSVVDDPSPFADAPLLDEDAPQGGALPLDLDEEVPLDLPFPEDERISDDLWWQEEAAAAADAPPEAATRPLRGWQEIFPDTASSADAALDLGELESHYDLGIGYKEMGLYREAIREFSVAAANPGRRIDCLTLQAICYREKGEPAKAEDLLKRGLDLEVLYVEERMCLSYELAYLFETMGAVEEAILLYREVSRINPVFHDVGRRLSTLAGDDVLDIIDLDVEEEN